MGTGQGKVRHAPAHNRLLGLAQASEIGQPKGAMDSCQINTHLFAAHDKVGQAQDPRRAFNRTR